MPNKRIQIKITIGKNSDGTLARKSFYGRTKKEANAKAQKYLRENTFAPVDRKITLAEWAEKWLEVYKQGNVSEITYQNSYCNPVYQHIIPYFQNAKLIDIKQIDIIDFFNTKKEYSKSTLNKLKITLSSMFNAAIDNDLIVKNPVKNVQVSSQQEPGKKRAYTKEQVEKIIEFAKEHDDGAEIIVLLKTGLRRGELLALRWEDIDFQNNLISVRMSLAETGSGVTIGPPKTKASMADIPFDNDLKKVLMGLPRSISGYVFPNTKDKLRSPTGWHKRGYRRFMIDMQKEFPDIPVLSPHELRHTFGSLVYEATKDIYITSKLMRHTDINVTAKIYVHESLDTKRTAIISVFKDLRT